MNTTYYQFTNRDESYTGAYDTLTSVLKDCSDYKTFKLKAYGLWVTREGGFVERIRVEN